MPDVDYPVALASPSPAPSDHDREGGPPAYAADRDWSSTLDLIQEATAAIRISEDRSSDLERQIERTVAEAEDRIRQLETLIALATHRAEYAERRATDAEAWLARLHDAVVSGFSRNPVDEETGEASASATP